MPKFLIVRFSSIGDIVLTTPVVRCLKQQVENAEVHYLTKKTFASVIQNNPYIDQQFYLRNNLSEVLRALKAERYDFIIDLHHNLRTWRLKRALGVKSFSFNKINIQKWIAVNLKINNLPPVHIVDRYMDTVKKFGVKNDNKGLDHFITEEDEKAVEQLPETHRKGYIAFAIGARFATKRLPPEKIISICQKIDQPIVLLGGKDDRQREYRIINAIGEKTFGACGNFSLNQSAALVKHASKVITHDTGLMHIASAFKKDIISVWGNTIPEFGMSPYMPGANSKILEVKGLSCRPCSKLGYNKCPKGHFKCMKDIDESVFIQ